MKIPKYIILGNYNYSGSGAVADFLREFPCLYCEDAEIRFVTDPYGIIELESKLIDNWDWIASSAAVSDFVETINKGIGKRSHSPLAKFGLGYGRINPDFENIVETFVNKLIDFRYENDCYHYKAKKTYVKYVYDRITYGLRVYTKGKIDISIGSKKNAYFSRPDKETFYTAVREFFNDIYEPYLNNGQHIVLDQALTPNEATRLANYFDDAKMIIIDRDLRDIYADSCLLHKDDMFANMDAKSAANNFLKLQAAMREKTYNSSSLLRIKFEDLVTDYDVTTKQIMDFLGLAEEMHVNKKKHFNPEVSVKNVGLWRSYVMHEGHREVFERIGNYCS